MRAQVQYWKDSVTLFEHALAVTDCSYVAEHNLGAALAEIPGRSDEAMPHYREALRLRPDCAEAHYNLGGALMRVPGRKADAIAQFEASMRLRPDPRVQALLNQLRAGRN